MTTIVRKLRAELQITLTAVTEKPCPKPRTQVQVNKAWKLVENPAPSVATSCMSATIKKTGRLPNAKVSGSHKSEPRPMNKVGAVTIDSIVHGPTS